MIPFRLGRWNRTWCRTCWGSPIASRDDAYASRRVRRCKPMGLPPRSLRSYFSGGLSLRYVTGMLRLGGLVLTGLGCGEATKLPALLSPETLHECDRSEHRAFKLMQSRARVERWRQVLSFQLHRVSGSSSRSNSSICRGDSLAPRAKRCSKAGMWPDQAHLSWPLPSRWCARNIRGQGRRAP